MKNQSLSDDEIIDRLRSGGGAREGAWRFMYENWRGLFYAQTAKMGGTRAEADAALGAVCTGFQNAVTAPGFVVGSSLAAYLCRCVRNQWIKNRLAEGKLKTADLPADFVETVFEKPGFPLADPEIAAQVDLLIEKTIGPDCRKMLRLFAEGYKFGEIGQFLGKTEGAAKAQKHDCQKKIRDWLAQNPAAKNYLTGLIYG